MDPENGLEKGTFNADAPAFHPDQHSYRQSDISQLRHEQQDEHSCHQGNYADYQYRQEDYQGFYQQAHQFSPSSHYQYQGPNYNSPQYCGERQYQYSQQQAHSIEWQQRGSYYSGGHDNKAQQRQESNCYQQQYSNQQRNDWRQRDVNTPSRYDQQHPKGKAGNAGNAKQQPKLTATKQSSQQLKHQTPVRQTVGELSPGKDCAQPLKIEGEQSIQQWKKIDKVGSSADWEGELEPAESRNVSISGIKDKESGKTAKSLEKSDNSVVSTETSLAVSRGEVAVTEESHSEDVVVEVEELRGKYAKLKEPDPRPHLNVIFIGHVDAGKSTTCGNILFLTGEVDQRTIEKYEREAKEKNRDTWFFAFITDVNEEERQKGKTIEVGRASFELENTRFTILDAPGHKSFVPNMISGAAQADVAVLIISARKGEFETGFERGGQTREHAMLSKTLGVSQIVVAVNKMDDPTCNWNEERFNEIERKLTPFLKGCGFNPAKDITFVPISGLSGQNLKLHATDPSFKHSKYASWYDRSKPTLFEILNNLKPPERNERDPLRIPLLEGFRDQGIMAIGKVEAGIVVAGQNATLMPKRLKIQVVGVQINDEEVSRAKPGENVTLRVTGVEEDQITKGMVLCSVNNQCPVVTTFKAQVMIVELLEHRPLITVGYSCVIHAHTACEEVQLTKLFEVIDKTTRKKKINPQFVKGNSMIVCEMQVRDKAGHNMVRSPSVKLGISAPFWSRWRHRFV